MDTKMPSVLCVDDEPNILRTMNWMLRKEFHVMTAPDGPTALQMLRTHDFDVIVSDQRMPQMMGSEFLRQACALAPRAMRILLTGYSDMPAILKSINEGEVFRFVNKPWSNEELICTVREAAAIAQANPVPRAPEAAQSEAVAGGERILVLDQDPELLKMLQQVAPKGTHFWPAHSLSDAIEVLDAEPVAVVVSETRLGRVDTTPLLKLLKKARPETVTIVISEDSDVETVVKLINQAQVYRFIPKPVQPNFLRIMLASAVQKHLSMTKEPAYARRHQVERLPAWMREKVLSDVQSEVDRSPAAVAIGGASFVDLIGDKVRRLFAA